MAGIGRNRPRVLKSFEVTILTGLSKRQLAYHVKVGGGPKYFRTNDGIVECENGRLVRYREDDVTLFAASHIRGSVREKHSLWRCNSEGYLVQRDNNYVGPGENPPNWSVLKRRPKHHEPESAAQRERRGLMISGILPKEQRRRSASIYQRTKRPLRKR